MARFTSLKKILISGACLCAVAPVGWATDDLRSSPSPQLSVKDNTTKNLIEITGTKNSSTGLGAYEWWLVTSVDKKAHAIKHFLKFKTTYSGKIDHFVRAVNESNSHILPLTNEHTDKKDCVSTEAQLRCTVTERVSIELEDSDLRNYIKTGFKIKINTQDELDGLSYVLPINSSMLKSQLDETDKYSH